MGLDMYAFRTMELLASDVDFDVNSLEEIHVWRKHPDLHGWMEKLYRIKGGEERLFNCTNVALNKSDIYLLESAIVNGTLPITNGFFFGESDGTELADDLEFIAKAKDALSKGYQVFYRSWW